MAKGSVVSLNPDLWLAFVVLYKRESQNCILRFTEISLRELTPADATESGGFTPGLNTNIVLIPGRKTSALGALIAPQFN